MSDVQNQSANILPPSQPPRDLTSVLTAIQNGVQAMNNLTQTLKTIFPSS